MMSDEPQTDPAREILLLEKIEDDPDVTQASLAALLGVAVGTVNWHLRRLIEKGYVKVKRAQRRKLRYIITPEGIAFGGCFQGSELAIMRFASRATMILLISAASPVSNTVSRLEMTLPYRF